eukprot:3366487-Amphidinium_carterae.1
MVYRRTPFMLGLWFSLQLAGLLVSSHRLKSIKRASKPVGRERESRTQSTADRLRKGAKAHHQIILDIDSSRA